MAVRTRGRRKIICDNKTFVWYVEQDHESPFYVLNIVSEDRQLVLTCPLNTKIPYIISKGRVFQGRKTDGRWNRFRLPFAVPGTVTPGFVSELTAWAAKGTGAVGIAWDGHDIIV